MIKGYFDGEEFNITISVDKFNDLWDDSYYDKKGYCLKKYPLLEMSGKRIDLDSFVSDIILSVLDRDGNEDESVNNEHFENHEGTNCSISKIEDNNIYIIGVLKKL